MKYTLSYKTFVMAFFSVLALLQATSCEERGKDAGQVQPEPGLAVKLAVDADFFALVNTTDALYRKHMDAMDRQGFAGLAAYQAELKSALAAPDGADAHARLIHRLGFEDEAELMGFAEKLNAHKTALENRYPSLATLDATAMGRHFETAMRSEAFARQAPGKAYPNGKAELACWLCNVRYFGCGAAVIGGYTGAALACTAFSGGLAFSACIAGAVLVGGGTVAICAVDLAECLETCD